MRLYLKIPQHSKEECGGGFDRFCQLGCTLCGHGGKTAIFTSSSYANLGRWVEGDMDVSSLMKSKGCTLCGHGGEARVFSSSCNNV